jgi:hypothetical protein
MSRKCTHDSIRESISTPEFDTEANERAIRASLAAAKVPADIVELLLPQMLVHRKIDQELWLKSMAYWEPVLNSAYGQSLKWEHFFGLTQREIRTLAVAVRKKIPRGSPVRLEFKIPNKINEVPMTWQRLKAPRGEPVP